MKELFFWFGAAVNITVGIMAVGLAFMYMFDWAIGRIGRHVKAYGVLIEFAFHRREFMQWRRDVKGYRD